MEGRGSMLVTPNEGGRMRKIMIAVMASIFMAGGLLSIGYAGDTRAAGDDVKGEVKKDAHRAKGETKGAVEDMKGNHTTADMDRAEGRVKGDNAKAKEKAKANVERSKVDR
jgi:hypothetical protein